MKSEDYKKIKIGEHEIGIIGLEAAFHEVEAAGLEIDSEEIKARLVKLIRTKNYVPSSAEKLYAESLFREYRKWRGDSVEEEEELGLPRIVILGPGCAQCNDLEQAVVHELARMKIPAGVEHVTDPVEIARYGIVRTPALVINGKIVSAGLVPNSRRLKEILGQLTKC